MRGAELEAYRAQWTVEADHNRKARFSTAKTIAQNAPFGAETARAKFADRPTIVSSPISLSLGPRFFPPPSRARVFRR